MFKKALSMVLVLASLGSNLSVPAPQVQIFTDARDQNAYTFTSLNGLYWFTENLCYTTDNSIQVSMSNSDTSSTCGLFYSVEDAFKVCPDGWRLPTKQEVKALLKKRKYKKNLIDLLQINLCGRIDNDTKHTKAGLQNTFWIDSELIDGAINHWHIFGDKHHLHTHNVSVAKRKFPVRCVCEI